jgi:hypothetical protein
MRRERLKGREIGRARLDVIQLQVIEDRWSGMSLTKVANTHGISRASVRALIKKARRDPAVPPVDRSMSGQAVNLATLQA